MGKLYKTFEIEVKERNEDGGTITISTGGRDRDNDRVFPGGAQVQNYLENPVVQFGHNYRDPWATVGRTKSLDIGGEKIKADFQLRPAANEMDPQNIVRLLWSGDWIRAASIGFQPNAEHVEENEFGGLDFKQWELLEWSLVAIPANQEALARIAKGMGDEPEGDGIPVKMPCAFCDKETEVSRTLAVYALVGKQPVFCSRCNGLVEKFVIPTVTAQKEATEKPAAPAPEEVSAESQEEINEVEGEEPNESLSEAEADRTEPDSGQATRSDDAHPVTDDDPAEPGDTEPEIDEDAIAEALTPFVEALGEFINEQDT